MKVIILLKIKNCSFSHLTSKYNKIFFTYFGKHLKKYIYRKCLKILMF